MTIGYFASVSIVTFASFASGWPVRHDDAPVPAIAGQQHQIGEQLLRAGVDREVDAVALRHVGDLLGGALVQMQLDVRIALAELPDHRRQHVARLGVRRADRERAAAVALLLVGQALDALDFLEDLHARDR